MRGTPFLVLLSLLVACSCKTVPKPPLTTRYDPKTEVLVVYQDPKEGSGTNPYAAAVPKRFASKKSPTVDGKIQSSDTYYNSPSGEEFEVTWAASLRKDITESFRGIIDDALREGSSPLTKGSLRGALKVTLLPHLNPKIPMMKPTNVLAIAADGDDFLLVEYKGKLPAAEASKKVRRVFESVAY